MSDLGGIRRVVSGHSVEGVAKVIFEDVARNKRTGGNGTVSTLIWSTTETPAHLEMGENIEDGGSRVLGTAPPPGGSRFVIIDLPPHSEGHMHRTDTIDYAIVMHGSVEMKLDESSVMMNAGDVIVQRGSNHAWNNHGSMPARIGFVLIDAQPLPIAGALKDGAAA